MSGLQPLRGRLARLDPSEARARNRALAVLNGLAVDGGDEAPLQVAASVLDSASAVAAFVFAAPPGWLALAPEVVDGAPVELDPTADGASTLATLGRLEPFLTAVEAAGGVALDPVNLEAGVRPGALTLRFSITAEDGAVVHAGLVQLSTALALAWRAPETSPTLGLAETASIACRLSVEAPVLSRREAAGLREGDLVLLPRAGPDGWAATLIAPDGRTAVGRYAFGHGRFTLFSFEDQPMSDAVAEQAHVETPAPPAPFAVESLPVALRVVIDEVMVSAGELARLGVGAVLSLPDLGDSPRVTILAQDHPIAQGRLMAVGEAYGVLIETVAVRDAA